jgi:hypothetical protein
MNKWLSLGLPATLALPVYAQEKEEERVENVCLGNLNALQTRSSGEKKGKENFIKRIIVTTDLLLVFGLGLSVVACQTHTAQQIAPKVKVGSALKAKASSPAAPATAKNQTQKNSIGQAPTTVQASQPSSSWTEELDVDDDGAAETSDFLYDAQRGVLYTYRAGNFACPNGNPASGSILEALYAAGNKAGNPVGSGWYAVSVNTGQCNAQQAGTFGCNFDASGNATACGAVTINYSTGEMTIASAQ